MPKNILIYAHIPDGFSFIDGGTVAQYNLARQLDELGCNVRLHHCTGVKIENTIFNKFYNNDFPIDNNAVVIYCEGTQGNPLNARYAVRWLLSELGQNVPRDWINGWGKDELVYYFNSERKFYDAPEKLGVEYKLLNSLYINPNVKQKNYGERTGVCYTIRKAHLVHKHGINSLHFYDSYEITRDHTQEQCIEFFNSFKWFISYDSLTFLTVIAALCGCISVVYKINGLTKQDWIKTTAAAEYCKSKGLDNLYGIAYGVDDILNAFSTIHLAKEQWEDILKFNKENTIVPFINDIENFENALNTIQNNYYS